MHAEPIGPDSTEAASLLPGRPAVPERKQGLLHPRSSQARIDGGCPGR